ncbi:hypothetical protein HanRHA438_Chr01g0013751 [Helianthus annuus]|nr:hypothetical protein HanRHA438_Chr01g0013751 [Helianthus annuus]
MLNPPYTLHLRLKLLQPPRAIPLAQPPHCHHRPNCRTTPPRHHLIHYPTLTLPHHISRSPQQIL